MLLALMFLCKQTVSAVSSLQKNCDRQQNGLPLLGKLTRQKTTVPTAVCTMTHPAVLDQDPHTHAQSNTGANPVPPNQTVYCRTPCLQFHNPCNLEN